MDQESGRSSAGRGSKECDSFPATSPQTANQIGLGVLAFLFTAGALAAVVDASRQSVSADRMGAVAMRTEVALLMTLLLARICVTRRRPGIFTVATSSPPSP